MDKWPSQPGFKRRQDAGSPSQLVGKASQVGKWPSQVAGRSSQVKFSRRRPDYYHWEMKFNLICDESGTSERYLVVGGLTLPRTNHEALATELAALKKSKGFRPEGEFKWGKPTNTSKVPIVKKIKNSHAPMLISFIIFYLSV